MLKSGQRLVGPAEFESSQQTETMNKGSEISRICRRNLKALYIGVHSLTVSD